MMFAGLMSLCTMPAACASASPSPTSLMMSSASPIGTDPHAIRCFSVSPW